MELKIRTANEKDIDRVWEIERVCFPPAEAASLEKYRWRLANYPDYLLVGETGEKIVSAISMIPMAAPVITDEVFEMERGPLGNVCAVLSVITDPGYQKQGFAGRMLEAASERARELGMKSMALTCKEHLIHYYGRFGYENLGVSQSVHGGAVWYDMVKKL